MEIIVTNSETNQYIRTITEEEFFKMCGNDKRMFNDYVNRLKKNPYVKQSKENWTIKKNIDIKHGTLEANNTIRQL